VRKSRASVVNRKRAARGKLRLLETSSLNVFISAHGSLPSQPTVIIRLDVERDDVERDDVERDDVERVDVERVDVERDDVERVDVERNDVERDDVERDDQT